LISRICSSTTWKLSSSHSAGRRDLLVFGGGPDDRAVGLDQDPCVVVKSRRQQTTRFQSRAEALGGRETFGVLLQALDAEELGTDRRLESRHLRRVPTEPFEA
jgi:hypothetical protein